MVESAKEGGGSLGTIEALRRVLGQAMTDRHVALAAGATSITHPAWNMASLVECWAAARLAAAQRRISMRAYDKIDQVIWQFVSSVLPPQKLPLTCSPETAPA